MKRLNVTEFFRISMLARNRHVAAVMLSVALATPAFASQPADNDLPQIVIAPRQLAEAAAPQLVPPAPETEFVAVQAEDPFPPSSGVDADEADYGVEIIPAASTTVAINGRSYEDVYRSIPFNYTEYLANPGYRHDAAMEILFGTLRPTTIVKQYEPQVIQNQIPSPYQPYRYSHSERWQYRAPDFRLLNPGCYW